MEDKVVLSLAGSVLFILVLKMMLSFAAKPRLNLPPGPWTLPLIGSIHHLLGTNQSVHSTMRTLAKKHGPLMQLWFGEVPMVVASSREVAQEILRNQDLTFLDRHMSTTTAIMSYDGSDMSFAPYGERWRQLRKLCATELLSVTRVRSFQRVREDEVALLVRDLQAASAGAAAVDFSERITKMVNDTVLRCLVGSRSKHREEYLRALRTAILLSTGVTVADLFPSSKLARMCSMAPRSILACRNKMENIIRQIMQERKDHINSGGDGAAAGNKCFVDVLLSLQKDGGLPIPVTDRTIVLLLLDLFAGGSDTSSSILIWALAELIRSPRIMAKAVTEVRQAFQGKNTIIEDDIVHLSYLKMVINECLRMHCPVPLLVPHKCRETCKVMGYDVPKGMSVFINVWALCRDSSYWKDAEEFKPERFENNDLDYKGSNFNFLPFGSGRRMCPGMNFGLANIEFALASLLYHFDWKLPDGKQPEDIDMRETPGLVAAKLTSLHLCPIPRVAFSNA